MSAPDRKQNQLAPGNLWSLWDLMRKLPIADLMLLDVSLASQMATYDHKRAELEIGPDAAANIEAMLKSFEAVGADSRFTPTTYDLISKARGRLGPRMKNGAAFALLSGIHEVFHSELSKKGCFLLDADEMAYADHPALFGEAVTEAFPSTTMDIREIGNCFAAERYNASAYHCVQAAEIGLRELARDRRINSMDWRKPAPLENAQWGHLIGCIRPKIDKVKGWADGPVKDAGAKFYENALLDLIGINDGWRRHLAHARSHQYERDDVIGLMAHTRRVLQNLARRLGERRTVTAEVWKRVPPGLAD